MSLRDRVRDVFSGHFLGGVFSQRLFEQQADAAPRMTHFGAALLAAFTVFLLAACLYAVHADRFYTSLAQRGVRVGTTFNEAANKSFLPRRSNTIKYRVTATYGFEVAGRPYRGKATFEQAVPFAKGSQLVVVYDPSDPSRNTASTSLAQWKGDAKGFMLALVPGLALFLFWLTRYVRWQRRRRLQGAGDPGRPPSLASCAAFR